MRRRLLLLLSILLLTLPLVAQERHTLSVAQPAVARTEYTIRFILLDWENRIVDVSVQDNNGVATNKRYDRTTTPTGQALMVQLNKANLATQSLINRVLARLATDGVVGAGTVTGSPE